MTTTQAALARIYRDALGYCADNGLNTANRDADRNTLEASLTRLAELEKAAEGMAEALVQISDACETGNIDSPEIGERGHKCPKIVLPQTWRMG